MFRKKAHHSSLFFFCDQENKKATQRPTCPELVSDGITKRPFVRQHAPCLCRVFQLSEHLQDLRFEADYSLWFLYL